MPGHGAFDGRIATIRMKGMRHGVQLAETLNLLAGETGWNRTRVARAMSDRYGDHAGYAYDPFGGDAYDSMSILDYYRLHADLLATIADTQLPGDFDGDGDVDAGDLDVILAELTGPDVLNASAADLDGDEDVDLIDFRAFQLEFTGSQ